MDEKISGPLPVIAAHTERNAFAGVGDVGDHAVTEREKLLAVF